MTEKNFAATAPTLVDIHSGSSISLVNDSPFLLTAIVQSQNGIFLGQETIQPGQQSNLIISNSSTPLHAPDYAYNTVLTPYTVIWKCQDGGYYSMCTVVSPGAQVRANLCPGMHYCDPPTKKKKATSCPSCTPSKR